MCSRYEIRVKPAEFAERFKLHALPEEIRGGELRPTDLAPIIRDPGACEQSRWGLMAPWNAKPVINARAETLGTKGFFHPLLARRCLVPASSYFEWRPIGRQRSKYRIGLVGDRPFAFAGIYDATRFAIVTCAPASALAHVHERMPVILAEDDEAAWIDPARPFYAVHKLLRPTADRRLRAVEDRPPHPRQGDLFG